jgi:hypothetical protein
MKKNKLTDKLVKRFPYWLSTAAIITVLSGGTYLTVQQSYRQSANDPQIQLAEDTATTLSTGATPQALIPSRKIDMKKTLAPFGIVYDENGKIIISSVSLDGKDPVLPPSIFSTLKTHDESRFTWEPQKGARIAAVVRRYNNGYILAGRSLREIEKRENQLLMQTAIVWGVAMIISFVYLFI